LFVVNKQTTKQQTDAEPDNPISKGLLYVGMSKKSVPAGIRG